LQRWLLAAPHNHPRLPTSHTSMLCRFKRENHPSARLAASGAMVERCRFCHQDLTVETRSRVAPASPALEHVCNSPECEEKARQVCPRVKDCGHFCGGVCDEEKCLPCFHGCDGVHLDADLACSSCYTETLGEAPSVLLDCGHAFHASCLRKQLELKWDGPRITFKFMGCPTCRRRITHAAFRDILDPMNALEAVVIRKALMRLSYENLDKAPGERQGGGGGGGWTKQGGRWRHPPRSCVQRCRTPPRSSTRTRPSTPCQWAERCVVVRASTLAIPSLPLLSPSTFAGSSLRTTCAASARAHTTAAWRRVARLRRKAGSTRTSWCARHACRTRQTQIAPSTGETTRCSSVNVSARGSLLWRVAAPC